MPSQTSSSSQEKSATEPITMEDKETPKDSGESKTEEEKEAERLYEERIEEEYAKREGGA
ncbi:hypothetical protein HYFRA_00003400 [Hymenoscyphus fraxineus]|uniref:Uncharacterized protein n=1 Tax=Hymenoscyphus fraxineus TaxID=746836 RepID=A0A9N9KTJ3_9HELO|nr:hypothetical protein HYFRA_00003400 [Hymenoscyphus fraxineus]